jgi:hypothetical protein
MALCSITSELSLFEEHSVFHITRPADTLSGTKIVGGSSVLQLTAACPDSHWRAGNDEIYITANTAQYNMSMGSLLFIVSLVTPVSEHSNVVPRSVDCMRQQGSLSPAASLVYHPRQSGQLQRPWCGCNAVPDEQGTVHSGSVLSN